MIRIIRRDYIHQGQTSTVVGQILLSRRPSIIVLPQLRELNTFTTSVKGWEFTRQNGLFSKLFLSLNSLAIKMTYYEKNLHILCSTVFY